jgi:predicted DNA-binding transcriptional regulator YafY
MLLLLQTRGRLTAAELAGRLEVCERTIYRDLDALSAAGVPVYAERGPHGGCVLRPGYRTDLTGLNASEVASLFAGTVGRQLEALGLSAGWQGALAKLEAALTGEQRAQAERVRARIHVDATPWFVPRESTLHLPALRDAVLEGRETRLSYRRPDGHEITRRTQPLGLVVKGGIWYLAALAGGEMRVYRVARLRRVAVTRRRFERPHGFDLAAFWSRWSSDFIARIPEYRVLLRVSRRGVAILPRVFGDRMRAALEAAGPPRANGLTLSYTFDTREDACGSVLGLGTLVEVLEPAELREDVRRMAAAVARLYGGSPRL